MDISKVNKLIKDHYNGNPWIDTTIATTLKPVSYTHLDVYKRQGCGLGVVLCGFFVIFRALVFLACTLHKCCCCDFCVAYCKNYMG